MDDRLSCVGGTGARPKESRPTYSTQYPTSASRYYTQYHPEDYHYGYRRPYENNYGYEQNYQYPYRAYNYEMPPPPPPPPPPASRPPPHERSRSRQQSTCRDTSTTRDSSPGTRVLYHRREHSVSRETPRSREPSVDPSYRRESFSTYHDHPEKRSRKNTVIERPVNKHKDKNPKQKCESPPTSEDENSDQDNVSEYSSEAESIETVITLLNKASLQHREPRESPVPMQQESCTTDEDTDIPISEKERKEYFRRLELIYATLDEHLTVPEAKQKVSASLARGNVTIKSRPESLPASQFIINKFDDYHTRAVNSIATVKIKKPKNQATKPEQVEAELVKVMSTAKPKMGFEKNPFNPKWLYKVNDAEWPDKIKTDDDITLLTHDNQAPEDTFEMKKKELLQIQQATSLSMNASTHLDWTLTATKKLLNDAASKSSKNKPEILAVLDLVEGAAYTNEFITDQNIYIHGGITNTIRQEYIDQMEDITPSEHIELLAQRYDAYATFNGQIPKIVKNVQDRDNRKALKKSIDDAKPKYKSKKHSSKKHRPKHLKKLLKKNYGQKSSKVGPRTSYGNYNSHGRKTQFQNRNDGQSRQPQYSTNQYQGSKKVKKSKSKSGYKGNNQGGRKWDHN